jgi:ABC-2 type transport system ATP-binding protein
MKQRLAIADILIKRPKVAFLDEPTASIDPIGINEILDMIAQISRELKMTVIISSHQLPQVQRICTRAGILSKGRFVIEGQLDQLARNTFGDGQLRVEVQLVETTSAIIERIEQIEGVLNVETGEENLLVNCRHDIRPEIARTIVEAEGLLMQMKLQSFALEDIYRRHFLGG